MSLITKYYIVFSQFLNKRSTQDMLNLTYDYRGGWVRYPKSKQKQKKKDKIKNGTEILIFIWFI